MKRIDTRDMRVVHFGREWKHATPPCHRSMTGLLERNERLVYWLQPKGGGVHDQIPALKLPDGYYTLSLRIMKLIYRNIRLRKGFKNVEAAQMGGHKLRIPIVLLTEKTRTQSRFMTMRMAAQSSRSQLKAPMSAASKVAKVVEDFFLPMTSGYFPPYTPFAVCPAVEEQAILERIAELFPACMTSRDAFVETVGTLYDRGVTGCESSTPTAGPAGSPLATQG